MRRLMLTGFSRIGKNIRPTKVGRYTLLLFLLSGCQYTIDTNPDIDLTEVHVSPIAASVTLGGHLSLSATVLGFSHTGTVTWSLVGTNPAVSTGTIIASGLTAVFTAPPAPGTIINIRVTSDEDPSRSVVCPVTILFPSDTAFTVDPKVDTLLTNAAQQFLLDSVTMLPAEVRWEITSGPGTISNTGLYTPPATIDSDGVQATVRATSLADNTLFSESTIILRHASDSLLCFTRDILPTLSASCGASGCHDAGGKSGFGALTYSGTVNGQNVQPGDARGSRLYQA
ncbi:MAG TPA: hypothetical protein VFD13_03465, partial [Candidatus Kapabacteria bacterium]|nr:hypothetical protein [Candidatus Kapabacteria bacterium]